MLLACVATVATSEYSTTTVAVLDPPPAPIHLTTQQGQTTRHVTVRIAPQKEKLAGSINITADVSARWVPADPPVGARPTLHVKWIQEVPRGSKTPAHLPFEENDANPLLGAANVFNPIDCEAKRECLWEADLDFTLASEAQGHVDISEWNLEVSITPHGGRELPEQDISITVEER